MPEDCREPHDKIHLAAESDKVEAQLQSIEEQLLGRCETIGSVVVRADRFMYQAKPQESGW